MTTTQQPQFALALHLTEVAADQVRGFLQSENLTPETGGLRVAVMPGGCSGFQYALSIEETPADDDVLVTAHGIRMFVDPFSAQYLNGVTIGYHSSMQGSGFTFDNPNASGGCGCGSSFTA